MSQENAEAGSTKSTEESTEGQTKGSAGDKENDVKNAQPNTESGNKFGRTQAFKDQFKAFSKFGDTKSDGKHVTLSQSDKWMKQAKVIDGKKVTTTDTGIYFKKFKCLKISLEDYRKFIEDLAKSKKLDLQEIENKMSTCGAPGLHGVSSNAKIDSTVERLTDTSKYTGSHKLRFDDTGKGKGIAGRKDIVDNSGYVSGYQNKDTYSKTH